jgi:hypothetical protein
METLIHELLQLQKQVNGDLLQEVNEFIDLAEEIKDMPQEFDVESELENIKGFIIFVQNEKATA